MSDSSQDRNDNTLRVARERLAERKAVSGGHYTDEEIETVAERSCKLIPEGLEIDDRDCVDLRLLCRLSRIEFSPNQNISSHRKLIGPLIVALKRLTWPFFKIHMAPHIQSINEFQNRLVKHQARQVVAITALKQNTPVESGR